MFGFALLFVGEFHCKIGVFLDRELMCLSAGSIFFILELQCNFCYYLSLCFHFLYRFIKYHGLDRYVGGGILVCGGSSGSGS